MEAMELILTRRSVRKFKPDVAVSDKEIEQILRSAMAAPSAGNQQPWHFVVIRDRKILDEIPKFHPYAKMLAQVPVAILVCGDETLEKHKGYWIQDCSAATQNLLLGAHAIGLGAVWLGIYPREDRVIGLRKLLKIPEHVTPLALIAIGSPAEIPPPANRYDKSKIKLDRW